MNHAGVVPRTTYVARVAAALRAARRGDSVLADMAQTSVVKRGDIAARARCGVVIQSPQDHLQSALTRRRMPVWPTILVQLVSIACAPDEDRDLPVVARGRYVEIATDRGEPVCGGTATYMDRVLDAAFAEMDERAPDSLFVRYEWLELDENDAFIGGLTTSTEDGVLIRSDVYLVDEHELVHAAQRSVWPLTNSFLLEGHAVLLDGKRPFLDAYPWPTSASLDDILEASRLSFRDYELAWFLVSQIVLDHGVDGLRDFWHAVPRGSTAAEVRAAYQAIFGRPIDALVEPYMVESAEPSGPTLVERRACDFALCPAPQLTGWKGDEWTARGPLDCEDDPAAVGPDHRQSDWGEVWRDYTMPGEPAYYTYDYPAKASVIRGACDLNCDHQATGIGNSFEGPPNYPGPRFEDWQSPVRVEVAAVLADLPLDPPRTFTLTRTFEPPE